MYGSVIHQHRHQQRKVCSKPPDRGEGDRIYILTRFRYVLRKSRRVCSDKVQQWVGLKPSTDASVPMKCALRLHISVCVCVCMRACVMDLSLDATLLCGLHSFQIPLFLTLDVLFDAQQDGRVPLVQA